MVRRQRRRHRSSGYSLVVLIMIFTVISTLAAAALPAIDQAIRREKEEELIFRGFQYAEAIRVFQIRFGRYPVKLEELVEVKPRCIRQLWKDPMTADGKWGLISLVAGGLRSSPGAPGMAPGAVPPTAPQGGDQPEVQANTPIIGVVSKSDKESIKTLFNTNHYNEWRFAVDTLRAPFGVGPNGTILRSANAGWIGRPFRTGAQGVMPGSAPGVGVPRPIGGPAQGGQPRPPAPPPPAESNQP